MHHPAVYAKLRAVACPNQHVRIIASATGCTLYNACAAMVTSEEDPILAISIVDDAMRHHTDKKQITACILADSNSVAYESILAAMLRYPRLDPIDISQHFYNTDTDTAKEFVRSVKKCLTQL